MKALLHSLVLFACVIVVPAGASDVDDFLREYRDASTRLRTLYGRCRASGTMEETHTGSDESEVTRHVLRDIEYAKQDGNEKIRNVFKELTIRDKLQKNDYSEKILISTPDRFIGLKRTSDAAPYSLAYLGAHNSHFAVERSFERTRKSFFQPNLGVYGFNLPNCLDTGELTIDRVGRESRDGADLVRVAYTIRPADDKISTQQGWCLLRPDADWSLLEYETVIHSKSPSTFRGSVSYKPGGRIPTPKWVSIRHAADGKVQTTTFSYRSFDHESPPLSEFQLSNYGLADAESPARIPRSNLSLWLAGIAFLALGFGFSLRLLARRREKKVQAA